MLYYMLFPVRIIVGLFMKLFGIVTGKYHIFLLGHYMIGSGKPVGLPEHWKDAAYDSAGHKPSLCDGNRHVYNFCGADKIYYGIGKAFVKWVDNKHLEIWDRYEFYAWCGKNNHFNGCSCEHRGWSSVTVFNLNLLLHVMYHQGHSRYKKFMRRVSRYYAEWRRENWLTYSEDYTLEVGKGTVPTYSATMSLVCLKLSVECDRIVLSLDISDKFFENLGKPFVVYHVFEYDKPNPNFKAWDYNMDDDDEYVGSLVGLSVLETIS